MQSGYWNKTIPAGAAAFLLGFVLSNAEVYAASGAVMILAAVCIAYQNLKRSSSCLCPAALFSLAWIGGAGVSCLKLSNLQVKWERMTWITIAAAWLCFIVVYMGISMLLKSSVRPSDEENGGVSAVRLAAANTAWGRYNSRSYGTTADRQAGARRRKMLLVVMDILTAVSVVSLLIEARVLGYIPLFTEDTPHAYSYFHISGLHYFTVVSALVPSFGILYLMSDGRIRKSDLVHVSLCITISILIPVLLVSRFQLIFSVILALMSGLSASGIRPAKMINARTLGLSASGFLMVMALYVFITVERAHSVEYLNGIFEMKNPDTPIWITQPYIYIANNFDNLNCLVRDLPAHTHGLRMLFPFFALTGLKFIFPQLVSFPIYVTKEELTTVTIVYDAYYDFGLAGVIIFAVLLGASAALLEYAVRRYGKTQPALHVLWAQVCFYLAFAFFTTWYSNPATWFYLGVTVLCLVVWGLRRRRRRRR